MSGSKIIHQSLPVTVHVAVFDGGVLTDKGFDVVGEFTMNQHFAQRHIKNARREAIRQLSTTPNLKYTLEEQASCTDALKVMVKKYVESRFGESCATVTKVLRNPMRSYVGWNENMLPLNEKTHPLLWTVRGVGSRKELIFATENQIWGREAALVSLKRFVDRPARFKSLNRRNKLKTIKLRAQDLEAILEKPVVVDSPESAFEHICGLTKEAIARHNQECANV